MASSQGARERQVNVDDKEAEVHGCGLTDVKARPVMQIDPASKGATRAPQCRWGSLMEFVIAMTGERLGDREIETAIAAVDPSVVIDIAPGGDRLRVSTVLAMTELVALLRLAGAPVTHDLVTQVPSICCGGCGG